MADETRSDRHTTDRHPIGVPRKLWDRFGRAVGDRKRSEVVRELIRRYLDGEPMPSRTDKSAR